MTAPLRESPLRYIQIITSGDDVYAKGGLGVIPVGKIRRLGHYKVSGDGNALAPIQGMPTFNSPKFFNPRALSGDYSGGYSGAMQFFDKMLMLQSNPEQQLKLEELGFLGPFAVSGGTFYTEYNFKLFRWNPGDREWYDTGQEETAELSLDIFKLQDIFKPHFIISKLAASGDTVYYGKRDGHLVVSFDRGNKWIDLTPTLPFPVKVFKDIVFAGSTVHVATDAGIITSDDGRNWRAVTDAEGTNLIMDKLTVDGTTLYGITNKTSVYRLGSDSDTWEQIVSEIPAIVNYESGDLVTSLTVAGNTLYVATERNGVLHFNLEK